MIILYLTERPANKRFNMDQIPEDIYNSLAHTYNPGHHSYGDHEQTLTLGDEDDGERSQQQPQGHKVTTLREFIEDTHDEDIRPPSLFDGAPPSAPPHMEGPRAVHVMQPAHAQQVYAQPTYAQPTYAQPSFAQPPYAQSNVSMSRSVYEARSNTQNPTYASNDSIAQNTLIPIIQLQQQPVMRPQMLAPNPVIVPKYHHPGRSKMGVVPPTISQSILSQSSASKLVPKRDDAEEYRKGVHRSTIICCVVLVISMLIGAVVAAAILQLL